MGLFMARGERERWGLELMLMRERERGEDLGVNTGVSTGVVLVEGSGVLKEKIDPL